MLLCFQMARLIWWGKTKSKEEKYLRGIEYTYTTLPTQPCMHTCSSPLTGWAPCTHSHAASYVFIWVNPLLLQPYRDHSPHLLREQSLAFVQPAMILLCFHMFIFWKTNLFQPRIRQFLAFQSLNIKLQFCHSLWLKKSFFSIFDKKKQWPILLWSSYW